MKVGPIQKLQELRERKIFFLYSSLKANFLISPLVKVFLGIAWNQSVVAQLSPKESLYGGFPMKFLFVENFYQQFGKYKKF